MPNLPPVFVFDLDNTLAECSENYVRSNSLFVAKILEHLPHLSPEAIRTKFGAVDKERYLTLGTHPGRHSGSMVETARFFFQESHHPFPDHLAHELEAIGQAVFTADYTPYPGALELLTTLRQRGCRLAICTKGDQAIQEYKLERHNYRSYVDAVHICHPKTSSDLLMAAEMAAPEGWGELIVVGDTRKDEIQAGQILGALTIWITNPTLNPSWDYDAAHDHIVSDFTLPTIKDVAPLLIKHNFFKESLPEAFLSDPISTPVPPTKRPAPVKLSR